MSGKTNTKSTYDAIDKQFTKESVAYWTKEELRGAGKKTIHQLATWNGQTTRLDDTVKKWLYDGGDILVWTYADQVIANQLLTETASDFFFSPVDKMKAVGGSQMFTEKEISLSLLTGETIVTPNSAIPVPPTAPQTYPNLTPLAALCACFVEVKNRQWIPITHDSSMKQLSTLYKGTGIKPTNFATLQRILVKYFEVDPVWVSLDDKKKDSVTGVSLLQMVKMCLGRLPAPQWLLVNAVISSKIFSYFVEEDEEWIEGPNFDQMNDPTKNAFNIPTFIKAPKEYQSAAREARSKIEKFAPYAVIYQGGWTPSQLNYPARAGTASSALGLLQFVRAVCGKNKSVNFLLDGAIGHSGLPTEFERKMNFFLSTALYLWSVEKHPVFQLESTGDVPILESSLTCWARRIVSTKAKLFGEKETVNDLKWNYLVSVPAEKAKIHKDHRHRVISAVTSEMVTVFYMEDTPQSMKSDLISEEALAADSAVCLPEGSYIGYGSVFGYAHFADDTSLQMRIREKLSSTQLREPGYCFKFGSSALLRGVMASTDHKAISLIGFDSKTDTFTERPLKFIPKQEVWYKTVETDLMSVPLRWLVPASRFSTISNLILLTKKAVHIIAYDTISQAAGFYVPDTVLAPVVKKEKRALKWDLDEAPVDDDNVLPPVQEGSQSEDDSEEEIPVTTNKPLKKKKKSTDSDDDSVDAAPFDPRSMLVDE